MAKLRRKPLLKKRPSSRPSGLTVRKAKAVIVRFVKKIGKAVLG